MFDIVIPWSNLFFFFSWKNLFLWRIWNVFFSHLFILITISSMFVRNWWRTRQVFLNDFFRFSRPHFHGFRFPSRLNIVVPRLRRFINFLLFLKPLYFWGEFWRWLDKFNWDSFKPLRLSHSTFIHLLLYFIKAKINWIKTRTETVSTGYWHSRVFNRKSMTSSNRWKGCITLLLFVLRMAYILSRPCTFQIFLNTEISFSSEHECHK